VEAALQLGFGERPSGALDLSAGIGHFKSMKPRIASRQGGLDRNRTGWFDCHNPESPASEQPDFQHRLRSGGPFRWDVRPGDLQRSLWGLWDLQQATSQIFHQPHSRLHICEHLVPASSGGVLMYITSRFTLDKKDHRIRKWLTRRFDLLAAVRLPETAFEENAGMKGVTDILIMQKRIEESEEVPLWVNTSVFKPNYRAATVNQYCFEHPDMIILVSSMKGRMW